MSTRNDLAQKRLTPDSRIAELEHDLDTAAHLLHEIVIAAFRREHGRDPATQTEYRSYYRKLWDEAAAAMAMRAEAPEWLATDDE
jgi:transposase-like protein